MSVASRAMAAEFDLTALVRAHQAELWRYLRYLGCDGALAEDLTQETFLSLVRNPLALENVSALPAYLRTIARNLFFKRAGRLSPAVPLDEIDDADAVWTRTVKEKDAGPYVNALRDCVQELDDRSRRALDLQYRDRLSQEAAARAIDLSREGFKTLLRRVRDRLKACVGGKLAHE